MNPAAENVFSTLSYPEALVVSDGRHFGDRLLGGDAEGEMLLGDVTEACDGHRRQYFGYGWKDVTDFYEEFKEKII